MAYHEPGISSLRTAFSSQFPFLSENSLKEMLTSFYICTGLNIFLSDMEGKIILSASSQPSFCMELEQSDTPSFTCSSERCRIMQQAASIGSAYFHTCHAGLCLIGYPLIYRRQQYGTVIAGPFLLEQPDAGLITGIHRRTGISGERLIRLSRQVRELPVISPIHATKISSLLSFVMHGLTGGAEDRTLSKRNHMLQQAKISEAIQNYKNLTPEEREKYPVTLENTLTARVKRGDTAGARTALNELFAFLLLYESYKIDKLKVRVIELCALLSRAAMEHNPDFNLILDLNEKLIREIIQSDDFNEICYILSDNIDIFTEQFLVTDQHHAVITKAIGYLSAHYSEAVTLSSLAKTVGVHPSYLSALFPQVTGLTFREYLNRIRIERALYLLTNTDYPIMDIAISCGFNDQSYFTKVFKKQTGLTPRQFR